MDEGHEDVAAILDVHKRHDSNDCKEIGNQNKKTEN